MASACTNNASINDGYDVLQFVFLCLVKFQFGWNTGRTDIRRLSCPDGGLLLGFGGLAAFRKRAAARVKALMAAAMAVASGCRRKAYAAPDTRHFALVNEGNPFVALHPLRTPLNHRLLSWSPQPPRRRACARPLRE